jgi:hypothetical protein
LKEGQLLQGRNWLLGLNGGKFKLRVVVWLNGMLYYKSI